MRIIDLLKDTDARVVYQDRWLVVGDDGIFHVYRRQLYQKKTRLLISTDTESEAIGVLLDKYL